MPTEHYITLNGKIIQLEDLNSIYLVESCWYKHLSVHVTWTNGVKGVKTLESKKSSHTELALANELISI